MRTTITIKVYCAVFYVLWNWVSQNHRKTIKSTKCAKKKDDNKNMKLKCRLCHLRMKQCMRTKAIIIHPKWFMRIFGFFSSGFPLRYIIIFEP